MQLTQYDTYTPQKNAHFPHSTSPLLAVHPSDHWLAFQTRDYTLVLRNCSTGRSIALGSNQHQWTSIAFTNRYLLASCKISREVAVYSLKTEKLKTKLTGHQGQITKVAYCRQNQLLVSISHDSCLVHSQTTLSHVKTIKCNSSAFTDVGLSQDGGSLVTSFKDGSVMLWDVENWQYRQSAVVAQYLKCAIDGPVVVVYDDRRVWLADGKKQTVVFQQLLPRFWHEKVNQSRVELNQVVFLDGCLVLRTTHGLFVCEIELKNGFTVREVKHVPGIQSNTTETSKIKATATSQYTSSLVTLTDRSLTWFKLTTARTPIQKSTLSPLTNQGLLCAGGYSKTTDHLCPTNHGLLTTNDYLPAEHRVEPITECTYAPVPDSLTLPKLKDFLRKHQTLPDKYRPIAYRMALNLPVSAAGFRELERKGCHKIVELIEEKYPIKDRYLSAKMRQIMSLLTHWQPVLGVAEYVPAIVFPFVCIFGEDTFLCFQTLYRLFSSPLHFLFAQHPLANSSVLQNMWQILKIQDSQLTAHLQRCKIPFARLAWPLLSTLFTGALPRQGVLAIADNILVRWDEPQLILFMVLGYLEVNRGRILSVKREKEAVALCEQEQTVHLPKYFGVVQKMLKKYRTKVRIQELLTADLSVGKYHEISHPIESSKMAHLKANITLQQLAKHKQSQTHKQATVQQMKSLTENVRRQAQRQMMEQQAYKMHCEMEQNQKIVLREVDRQERVAALEKMIDELSGALQGQKQGREVLRQYVPVVETMKSQADDRGLQQLQVKLMGLMRQVRPGTSLKHLANQPANLLKAQRDEYHHNSQHYGESLTGAVGARLANRLWELDQIAKKNQEVLSGTRTMNALRH